MKTSATMLQDISLEDSIAALFLCAEIFDYPTPQACEDFNTMFAPLFGCKFAEQDDVEAEYIRIFAINSVTLKCVPYASWWLDGKMSGATLSKINQFYTQCGYEFDSKNMKRPADHISFMIRFVAILLEDGKQEELKEFIGFLSWFETFVNSLNGATKMRIFPLAGEITLNIMHALKEKI
ncbi:TorD/DmsD family molecular chaperone [Sulfurospirillum sp. 1612]|uniref:TorD/DmsD family molecular chaperone n=1 Tax=Sulfurospirillum sp. 1612 TaxID=3094835 RepID=UPI002F95D3BC